MPSEPWYNRPESYGKPTNLSPPSNHSTKSGSSAAKGALKLASYAGKGIAHGAHVVSAFAANNPWGMRIFSFLCSIGLFVLAILGLIGVIGVTEKGHPASFYLFNAYMLMLTALIFIAECKDDWVGFKRLRPWTLEQFGFLQSNLGRGSYLIFIGLIWFGAWGWTWGLAGFLNIAVGLIYMAMHVKGAGIAQENPEKVHHVTLAEDPDDLP
jgi:hypothetical protein